MLAIAPAGTPAIALGAIHPSGFASPKRKGSEMENEDLLTHTADIAAAFVSNNSVAVGDIATLINSVYSSLSNLGRVDKRLQP
ncbi:MucR family transcriptional regulator [Sphingopyxis witflariensis]